MSSRLGSARLSSSWLVMVTSWLGSARYQAELKVRLGSFGSSSWLVWLTSQLKKKPNQLALAEPDASTAAGWWRNKKMSRFFLHGCGERGPAAGGAVVAPSRSSGGRGAPRAGAPAARPQGRAPAPGREAHRGAGREAHRRAGPRRQVVGGAGRAAGDDRTGEVAGRGRGRRRARRRGRSPQGGRRPPAARRAARRGAGREAAGQGAGPRRRVVGGAGRAAGDDRTSEVTGRGRGEATGLASRPAAAQRWEWECGTGRAGEGDLGFHFHRVEAGLLGRLDLSVGSRAARELLASWLELAR